MARLDELMDWDLFFYYGETGDLDLECRFDLYELLLQPKRSLFYARQLSAGIDQYENAPNTIRLQVLGRYEIASAVAYRNSVVTDGRNGTTDRRIAVSQNSINFKQSNENMDIDVLYFLYDNYEDSKSHSFQLGR